MELRQVLQAIITAIVGEQRPLWRDYSSNQGVVNCEVAAANGVLGMTARAGISWGYKDWRFPEYWQDAKRAGLYRNSYHVLHPDQDVTRQADNWYAVNQEIDCLPRMIDLEVANNQLHQVIAERTWQMSELVLARDGVRPWIYSRYLLINAWLQTWTADMLADHYYYLAQYRNDRVTEHPGPPTLPERVPRENILLHQTADKKAGFPGEAQSLAVDYVRWCLGDAPSLHRFMVTNYGTEDKMVIQELEERVKALEALKDDIARLKQAILYDPDKVESRYITDLHYRVLANKTGVAGLQTSMAGIDQRITALQAEDTRQATVDTGLANTIKSNRDTTVRDIGLLNAALNALRAHFRGTP